MRQEREGIVGQVLIWAFSRGVSHIDPNNLTETLIVGVIRDIVSANPAAIEITPIYLEVQAKILYAFRGLDSDLVESRSHRKY